MTLGQLSPRQKVVYAYTLSAMALCAVASLFLVLYLAAGTVWQYPAVAWALINLIVMRFQSFPVIRYCYSTGKEELAAARNKNN